LSLETTGRWLVMLGLSLAMVGGLVWLVGRFWPGLADLPGTIRIQTGGFTCLIPLLGSIVLSVVLTVVLNLILRLLRR
jgi:hypothetical protein